MTESVSGEVPVTMAGRAALVTGSSRGIGLAIARELLYAGAQVCITGRSQASLDAALRELGPGAIAVAGKADDREHQRAAVEAAVGAFGGLDYLVSNAGINPVYGATLGVDIGAARKIVEVNALALLGWAEAACEAGLGRRSGSSIVAVSSVAARVPTAGIGMYGASKAMLEQLVRQLALELAPSIRVNAVAPAVVRTGFSEALYAGDEEGTAADYPLGRLGEPADIAHAVAFLLSDSATWITGQVLVLDGGLGLNGGV